MCLKRFVDDRGAEFVKSRVRFKNISRSQAARVVDYLEKVCRCVARVANYRVYEEFFPCRLAVL